MNDDLDIDQNGLAFVSRWEGKILRPYLDVAKKWTIGVGHLILPTDSFGSLTNAEVRALLTTQNKNHSLAQRTISDEECLDILRKDMQMCVSAVRKYMKVRLNQNQFNALCSLSFNTGTGILIKSGVATAVNASRFSDVRAAMLQWNKISVGGKLVPNTGLTNRRKSEADLFERPVEYVEPPLSAEEQAYIDAQLSESAKEGVSYAVLACSEDTSDTDANASIA